MTKLPIENRNVLGFDGPDYQLPRICSKGGCFNHNVERHHIWRRSEVGNRNWLILPDGSAVGNIVTLCREHHRLITENRARIAWFGDGFYWEQDSQEFLPLAFQPPHVQAEMENVLDVVGQIGAEAALDVVFNPAFEIAGEKTGPILDNESLHLDGCVLPGGHEGDCQTVLDNECPTCHQPLPHPKVEKPTREKKRVRRSWTITVPMDKRENGAETLDTLLEEARLEMDRAGLGYGPERNNRFFVLAFILGQFVLHSRELLGDA